MAIVKSPTGKFYDLDDNALEGKEVKQEDLPKDLQRPGPGTGAGPGNLAGLIQVIVHVPGGGGPPQGGGEQGEGDVVGHHSRYCWRNCWRNCW